MSFEKPIQMFKSFKIEGFARGGHYSTFCKNPLPLLEISDYAVIFGSVDSEPTENSTWEIIGSKFRYAPNTESELKERFGEELMKHCHILELKRVPPANCFYCSEYGQAKVNKKVMCDHLLRCNNGSCFKRKK
jgi:hypothetical protein